VTHEEQLNDTLIGLMGDMLKRKKTVCFFDNTKIEVPVALIEIIPNYLEEKYRYLRGKV
jgi:hypothetical protein